MPDTKRTTERFSAALDEYVAFHRQEARSQTDYNRHSADADRALVRLEDAFNDAVDERVQQALAYANFNLRESER